MGHSPCYGNTRATTGSGNTTDGSGDGIEAENRQPDGSRAGKG